MDSLGKLGEIIKKAAKFLHFYNFDEKNIEEMIEDMCCMHPNEHSEAESRSIFEKILKNLTVVDQIKSCINEEAEFYIKYEQEQGSSLLPTLMQEEEITKQLEKSRFNVKKAVMAWFYRLFPRYTLQQIIKYHKKTLTRMNRMFFERNLKEAEQHQIVRIAELIIEYYEFDIKNRLNEMVEDLLVKAIHIADDNTSITPQFCKLVLRNVDINALKLRVENEFKESRDEVKDKHIKRTYRILQFKNIRNPAPKTPYPDRVKLLKRVFFDFNERYNLSQLRDRVNQYCNALEGNPAGNVAGRADNVAGEPKPGTSGVQQTTRHKPDVSKRVESKNPESIQTETKPNINYVLVDEPIMPTKSTTSPTKSTTSPTKSTTSPPLRMRSSPLRMPSPPVTIRSSPLRMPSPPVTIRSSPLRMRSPSPLRMRSPSPLRMPSPPVTIRSSPLRMPSSPVTIRSSPLRMRSPSPLRMRSPSPLRMRSPSPLRVTIRSSPTTMEPPPLRMRSPSPLRVTIRSPPTTMQSPPTTMQSPPTTMQSPPTTMQSPPTTMQSPPTTSRSEGSNLPSTTSGVTDASPKRPTRTPPRLITRTVSKSSPKETFKSLPKGTKRTYKSPDKKDVDHQPKKTKPTPSDDETVEQRKKTPEKE